VPKSAITKFTVKVNGQKLAATVIDQILDVTVEQDVAIPEAFTLRLWDEPLVSEEGGDTAFGLLSSDTFKLGASIDISLGQVNVEPASVFKGEITSVEAEARSAGGILLTVRGYDKAHRLHRERKTRTFVQVTDSDVASTIAGDHGLTASASVSGPIHEHLYQDNQTDWEFLRGRANDLGCELYVRDSKLVMRLPASEGTTPTHKMEQTLQRIRLRVSAPTQVSQVTVKGWDPKTKKAIVGTASTASSIMTPSIGLGKTGAQVSSSAFGSGGKYAITAHNVATQDQATKLAQAVLDELAGEFIQLEGTCLGDPNVKAGRSIKLEGIGARYSGTYYVTSAVHKSTPQEGYVTQFTVSGRQPLTLGALLGGANGAANGAAGSNHRAFRGLGASAGRHGGVVVGVVTKNKAEGNDASKYDSCVKVKFPWLADEHESHWARLAVPMAGAARGFYFLPEVNDEVLVAFEHGDINRPYVVGGLWNGQDAPPKKASEVVGSDGKVKQRVLKSRTGHTITLDDSDDTPGITIVDKTGKNSITIDSKANKLTIVSEADMEITAKGGITMKGKTLTMEATGGAASITATGVTVDAKTGNMVAKGGNANVEAGTGKVTVKGTAGADIQTSAIMNIKGSLVNIN
jgi:phage protein D/phage baseplate assembly protein gpV